MREKRRDELAKVYEKGYQLDLGLASKCAYYPYFRFFKSFDEEEQREIVGQVFVCRDCSELSPYTRCKHSNTITMLVGGNNINKPKTILRKGVVKG